MKSLGFFLILAIGFQQAMAQKVDTIAEIGSHYRLFTVEKNENPENILVLFTKVDANCHIKTESSAPIFDMYWLMNRTTYKPTHQLIKKGVKDRLQLTPANADSFYVKIKDLDEVKHDLTDPRLLIDTDKFQGQCNVRSVINLGPSDKYAKIQLTSIYSEATKIITPPFRKLKFVTLNGVNIETGAKVSRKYLAK